MHGPPRLLKTGEKPALVGMEAASIAIATMGYVV